MHLMIEQSSSHPSLSFTRHDQLEIVFQIPYDEVNSCDHLREPLAPIVVFVTGRWRLVKPHCRYQKWIDLYVPLTVEPDQLESGNITPIAEKSPHRSSE